MRYLFAILLGTLSVCSIAAPKDDAKAAAERGDYKSAFEILLPLAEAGDVDALGNVGNMYAFGQGTERDYAKAYSYWSRAADKHLGSAMGNIAVLYTNGLGGVNKDKKLAAHWYRQAAEHRHFPSMLALSSLYATGEGIEKDPIRAMAWAGLAASNAPNQRAQQAAVGQVQAIGRGMSKEDIDKAQSVSNELRLTIDANIKKYKEQ